MRRVLIFLGYFTLASVCSFAALPNVAGQFQKTQQTQQSEPPKQASPQNAMQIPATPPNAAQQAAPTLRTVVIDPGHGGEDTGARGPSGVAEKDIVLEFAQAIASAVRADGFQVVLTRQADADPSLDDRAAIANAQANAIFISLHVGSTGAIRTASTYSYIFPMQQNPPALSQGTTAAAPPPGFLPWREAQESFVVQSQKLGDLIQVELAQKFKGSPEVSRSIPIAALRSVATPAVAVEISSVAADQGQLESMSSDLAYSIARALAAYKTIYPPGGK